MSREIEEANALHDIKRKYQVSEEKAIIDTIKKAIVIEVEKMSNGEEIDFEDIMMKMFQSHNMNRNPRVEKQLIYEIKKMLEARRKISCLKDGKYIKDEYGIIADKEGAMLNMEKAIKVARRIKAEIEDEGKKPTQQEILKRLAKDWKENELYRTSIIILCSDKAFLGEKEDLEK